MTIRVYADTSVYGGAFEDEFQDASNRFFDDVRSGRFQLITSPIVEDEVAFAPQSVRQLFDEMLRYAEAVGINGDVIKLQTAYLKADVVSRRWAADALHVALASVWRCSLLVSWNFRHIVHFQKIPLYNAINTLQGHVQIGIFSPLEVLHYESEDP